ncbi:MAG: LysR family transcriptional regulator [Burkholderiaceae bacterium]
MPFTLRQLQYFVAASEKGSISRAAQSLSISQSAVTESIKELEADLGVQLFERLPRGLSITHRGYQFLRHARSILGQVAQARQQLIDERRELGGHLHVGVTSLVAGYLFSDILARFRRANPAVQVSAIEDDPDYLEHLLIGGELDVALMLMSGLPDRGALQSEVLEISPYRLWMRLDHPLGEHESIELADIAEEPLIMLTLDEVEDATNRLLQALEPKPRIAFRTRSVEAVRSLVATGAGVALLPDMVYRTWSLEGDRIESRDISGALPYAQVGLAWRRGSNLSPAAREFVTIAQASRIHRASSSSAA